MSEKATTANKANKSNTAAKASKARGNTDVYTEQVGSIFNNIERRKESMTAKSQGDTLENTAEKAPEINETPNESSQTIDIAPEPENSAMAANEPVNSALSSYKAPAKSRSLNARDKGLLTKKDNRSHRISLFITEDRYAILQEIKKNTGVSVNSLLNAALDDLIEDNREFWQPEGKEAT